MDGQTVTRGEFRLVHHRTLHALCEQLRQAATRVVSPVHLFDIPPQVMRGLFSVALVCRDGEVHRCVVPYRDRAGIAAERQRLAKLLLWAEVDQAEGRVEVGAHTGNLLRYFLPNAPGGGGAERRHQERSYADWQAAAEQVPGPRQLWQLQADEGGAVGGVTAGGVHYLVRLQKNVAERLEVARRRLGCRIVGGLPAGGLLARDVLGDWCG